MVGTEQALPLKLKIYDISMQSDIESLYISCFSALNWEYEPEGRHADTKNIPETYQQNGQFWCLYDHETLIGTVAVRSVGSDRQAAELKRLYVAPMRQGQGFGAILFETALKYAKDAGFRKIYADTRHDRFASIHLMRRHGFREITKYNDNEFAELFFELDLSADVK